MATHPPLDSWGARSSACRHANALRSAESDGMKFCIASRRATSVAFRAYEKKEVTIRGCNTPRMHTTEGLHAFP
jgi:hypothetical protein